MRWRALADPVKIRGILADAIKTHSGQAQMKFVGDGLRPGFKLLVRRQIVPSVSSIFVEQAPSAVVGLLVAVGCSGDAVWGPLQSVSIGMAVCAFLRSLPCLNHTGIASYSGHGACINKILLLPHQENVGSWSSSADSAAASSK